MMFSILCFFASSLLDVIAINLLISPDHEIESFKIEIVSSVVKDFDETKKIVSFGFKFLIFRLNSEVSEPVINIKLVR